ncbi:MAG: FecR domain-containing protein [Verrucomicrobiales bacterium]|nr:FecR domain-containing protein [Verrucomicrobiales bacterium]
MNESISQELDDLMLSHQEDGLEDIQRARLSEILKQYPEARKQFAQQQLIDAALHLEQSAGVEMAPLPNPLPFDGKKKHPLEVGLIGLAASVLLALGLGLGLGVWIFDEPSELFGETSTEPVDNSVALLDQALDVEWVGEKPPVTGAPLSPGKLVITKGLLQIEFYSGVRLIVEGPAELELLGSNEAICHRGRLRAHVPEHARGFTIHSPKFQLVDLGTEFGIQVSADGSSEVQVFDGEVELYDPDRTHADGASPIHRLPGGNGLSWSHSGSTTSITPKPDSYTSFDEIQSISDSVDESRFKDWQEWSADLARDPRLIVYYDFEGDDSRLLDRGPSHHHGTIVGSEWNQGRFPGKRALEFKRTADRVRIDIPGQFEQVTLAIWLRMDALTGRTQALLLSDGFEPKEAHWQVSHRGELAFGVRLPESNSSRQAGYDSPPVLGPQAIGSWTFLCVVYDQQANVVKHFVNGCEVSSETIRVNQKLLFGPAEIGNWAKDQYQAEVPHKVRNFCGRIDELMIWRTALPDSEIRDIYLRTRP